MPATTPININPTTKIEYYHGTICSISLISAALTNITLEIMEMKNKMEVVLIRLIKSLYLNLQLINDIVPIIIEGVNQ